MAGQQMFNCALFGSLWSWAWPILGLLSIPLLVALNALFVAAEFALVAVRKTRVEELVAQGRSGATSVEHALTHLDRSIAATQLGITLASIALGWLGEPALARLLEPLFAFLPVDWVGLATHSLASLIAFLLITFMHVVFGELIPKTMALQKPDATALWIARPIVLFMQLTRPMIYFMNGTGNMILRWCGFQPATGDETAHSLEELALLIEDSHESGVLTKTQADVVSKTFRLSDKRVQDALIPLDKMAALELRTPPEKVLEAVRETAHTRLPIYDSKLDNIVGIVNTKDLFYLFSLKGLVNLEDALYPPLFLKPQEDVATALHLFRKARRPMAVVRNDNGKVLGLITLEDVLEEIVGDIEDEHDHPVAKRKPDRRSVAEAARQQAAARHARVHADDATAKPSGSIWPKRRPSG
jgi:putative hemolysin